ncbi:MAG: lipoyl(octanoyl) transferase LipB [Candidatus Omnitrophica bacterium]|nr:lipoyl(octanoyl) transferase LipB [Candidatus Omnitrophota bacterium]
MSDLTAAQSLTTGSFVDLGLIDYSQAYRLQKETVAQVIAGAPERVFLCEHPVVLTLGRMADRGYILASKDELAAHGIEILSIDRGGEVTLHAPGQLVVYPILDLRKRGKNLKQYLYDLEEVAIQFLQHYKIFSVRKPGKTGVWVGAQKIVSVGVGVRKWVTYHGLGININTDLTLFSLINPCGLNVTMASIESIIGQAVMSQKVKQDFCEVFMRSLRLKGN